MATKLDRDVFLCLADIIQCRRTLAALCRVSKDFRKIFTPVLCEHSLVQKRKERWIFRRTRELVLSRVDYNRFCSGEVLTTIFEGIPLAVETLTLETPINLFAPGQRPWKSFRNLVSRRKLHSLVIIAPLDTHFYGIQPSQYSFLQNMRKIVLHGIKRMNKFYIPDLANMLLASPHLRVLGLSGDGVEYDYGDNERFLETLCRVYKTRAGFLHAPRLQLEELDLGNGFQLEEDFLSRAHGHMRTNYLEYLTDLQCLRILRLDNVSKRIELRPSLRYSRSLRYSTESEYYVPEQPGQHIESRLSCTEFPFFTHYNEKTLLYDAVNLEKISFGFISCSLIEIIDTIQSRLSGLPKKLDSLQIGRYSNAQPPPLLWPDKYLINGRKPTASEALHMTGYHWRFFDFSDLSVDADSVLDFIQKCTRLESLTCGFSDVMLARFKTAILLNMEHLHTLMLTPYYRECVFAHPVTRIPLQMDIKEGAGRMPTECLTPEDGCLSAEPEIPAWKISGMARQEKGEEEEAQRGIASEIFDISWTAWEKRDEANRGTKLKYVGLGYRVYTYMWCGTGKSASGWTAVRLTRDHAMEFDAVRTMSLSRDEWSVRNRE